MKLVSTKRTAADKKAEREKYDKPCGTIGGEDYPYDTRLSLNKELLKKLGLSPKDFTVGQKVDVQIVASVKSLNSSEGETHSSNDVGLQIQQIGVEKRASSLKDAVSSGIKDAQDD